MALFQKKPNVTNSAPFYTLGQQKSLLITGLGNVGKEYANTRHNIGFKVVDELATKLEFPAWIEKKDLKCFITQQVVASSRVILIKPTTLMNLSGTSIQAVQHYYKIPGDYILVAHDELDIVFGQIRSRVGGSSAGHNGVQSIIDQVGEDFGRLRIGIGTKKAVKLDDKDFVLDRFSKKEQAKLPALLRETNAIITEFIYGQVLTAETRSFLV